MKWIMTLVAAVALMAAPARAAEFGKFGMQSIKIAVKDAAKSMEFYKHLGMKVGRLHHPGQQEMNWDSPTAGPAIILMNLDQTKLTPGTTEFLITVPDTAAVAKDLKAAGFPNIGEPRVYSAYVGLSINDPDGNVVYLMGPGAKK